MEILNLFFFTLLYYLIYSLPFFIKVFLVLVTCIGTSLYFNNEEEESNKYDYYIEFGNKILNYVFYWYNKFLEFIDYLITLPIFSNIYQSLNYLNTHFVKGRKIIMMKCSEKVLMPPMIPNFSNFNKLLKPKTVEYKEKKIQPLKDHEDILNFLDNLEDKKND